MQDMNGKEIKIGDYVIFPGGNARYGGLKLIIGLVTKITPKRVTLLTAPLIYDEKPPKLTTKSGHKVLKCPPSFAREWLSANAIQEGMS